MRKKFWFFFPFYFSTGLVRLNIAGLPLWSCPDPWATYCGGGPPMSVFFVSGSSRIRTHVLVIAMRTCYGYSTLTQLWVHNFPILLPIPVINKVLTTILLTFSLCFSCPTRNFPCANVTLKNFTILWQLSQYQVSLLMLDSSNSLLDHTQLPCSLCFGKLSKFPMFSLTGNFLDHFPCAGVGTHK